MKEQWADRLKVTQHTLRAQAPILALRRVLCGLCDLSDEAGALWVAHAKVARATGDYTIASSSLTEARGLGASCAIQSAKLQWERGLEDQAIRELGQELETASELDKKTRSKTMLLYWSYLQQTGQKSPEQILAAFKEASTLAPRSEKGYFLLGRFFDQQVENSKAQTTAASSSATSKSSSSAKSQSGLDHALHYYGLSLRYGHKYIFQSLPRLLTLYFEFSKKLANEMSENAGSSHGRKLVNSMCTYQSMADPIKGVMKEVLHNVLLYQWLTVLPQLISRITHPRPEVVTLLKTILTELLVAYPKQVSWHMIALLKSLKRGPRTIAAKEIIDLARKKMNTASARELKIDELADELMKMCKFGLTQEAQGVKSFGISQHFRVLQKMTKMQYEEGVGVMVPLQVSLTPVLPASGVSESGHNPFASYAAPLLTSYSENVEIMSSLQRPLKVGMMGTDGQEHFFLCKPKDDLRKDSRMMEFNTMINRLLSKHPVCRRRRLYIRTFAVIPLNEECGLIEWVPHTTGLRHVLSPLYKAVPTVLNHKQINALYERDFAKNPRAPALKQLFLETLVPRHPPVFHKWFLSTFSDPSLWFESRLNYARTTAVWSMIGHIVGLGDRHGENILFDATNGDTVHVDFSYLFDKGCTLEVPELVPFRFTANMEDALGLTGREGVFRSTCELVMSLVRHNRDTLMTVLETFVHDPLVEWTPKSSTSSSKTKGPVKESGGEPTNPDCHASMLRIESRLKGQRNHDCPTLPVQGQVQQLIDEASSPDNLSQMYRWWMPWM